MDYKELFIDAINSSSNDNLEELFENVKQVSDKLSNEIFLIKLRKIYEDYCKLQISKATILKE